MTQVALSKTALAAIDQIRAQRGIRTRAKALEVIALEAAGLAEHPLETKMRTAKTVKPDAYETERIEAYLEGQKNGTTKTYPLDIALQMAAERRQKRA